jgi:hypothetical protein
MSDTRSERTTIMERAETLAHLFEMDGIPFDKTTASALMTMACTVNHQCGCSRDAVALWLRKYANDIQDDKV